jgi:hypothetical protein
MDPFIQSLVRCVVRSNFPTRCQLEFEQNYSFEQSTDSEAANSDLLFGAYRAGAVDVLPMRRFIDENFPKEYF